MKKRMLKLSGTIVLTALFFMPTTGCHAYVDPGVRVRGVYRTGFVQFGPVSDYYRGGYYPGTYYWNHALPYWPLRRGWRNFRPYQRNYRKFNHRRWRGKGRRRRW